MARPMTTVVGFIVLVGVSLAARPAPRLSIVDIGLLPGGSYSYAGAINDRGQVAGTSSVSDVTHLFLWQNGTTTDAGARPFSAVTALNERGQFTGNSPAGGFLWSAGSLIELGTLGGGATYPYAINDRAQVVGWSDLEASTFHHAFLWENGTMTDLGTLAGGTVSIASAINKHGEVAGASTWPGGSNYRAVVWTRR